MKANLDKNLAPAWVSGKSYSTGEFCLYNKRLYICTTDNSDAEFDNSKWERRNLVDLVSGINSNLNKLTTKSITQPLVKQNQGINTFVFDFPHEVVGIVSITMPTLYNGYIQEIVSIEGNTVTLKNCCNESGGDFTLTVCGY